jgi:hypothetical protein
MKPDGVKFRSGKFLTISMKPDEPKFRSNKFLSALEATNGTQNGRKMQEITIN